jgi:hypothetical protein
MPFSTLHDVGDERVQRSHAQPAAGVAAPAGLAAEEAQKLRAAVQELTECRRLLEAALREKI